MREQIAMGRMQFDCVIAAFLQVQRGMGKIIDEGADFLFAHLFGRRRVARAMDGRCAARGIFRFHPVGFTAKMAQMSRDFRAIGMDPVTALSHHRRAMGQPRRAVGPCQAVSLHRRE